MLKSSCVHRQGLSVHPSHQAFVLLLEEHDGQLAPQGLAFVAPVLLPCQGLVLGDVQDHRGLAGELVHEASLEHRLQVGSPSQGEMSTRNIMRSRRSDKSNEISMIPCKRLKRSR